LLVNGKARKEEEKKKEKTGENKIREREQKKPSTINN